jgi:hypothetical protein
MDIWYNDLNSFFDINNLLIYFPTSDMVYIEKLNTILRLSMYISILLFAVLNDRRAFFLVIIVAIITYILYSVENNQEEYIDIDYDRVIDKEKYTTEEKCTKPTIENPFMNVMMNEYQENPKRGKACDVDQVKEYVDDYFENTLYRSVDDIYNKDSSTRQYYTMPNTNIPNDQEGFANWLYKIPEKTCKEGNGEKCKYFS